MINKESVLTYLEANKDARGIKIWQNSGISGMTSVGIGVTKLKAYAKGIGKNHHLAMELWDEPIFESKILATLIDDPKLIGREQINKQVRELHFWMLSHAYCNYLLPKFPDVQQLAEEWITSKNDLVRRCGFQLYYQIAKNNKKLPDAYFDPILQQIERDIKKEENFVKDAMNNALWSIGMRSKELNERCIYMARSIGKINVDYGQNSCEAIDVVKHLSADRIQKKFK